MILSGQQRDNLLDQMARMVSNKQTVAYANQSKNADRISNNDLALFIDSAKKEFVFKYSTTYMRLNARTKTFSELRALIFDRDHGTIRGITDTITRPDPTLALSARYGYNHEAKLNQMFRSWTPGTEDYSDDAATILGITDDGTYTEHHLLTYEYWNAHKSGGGGEGGGCDCGDKFALKEHTHVITDIDNLQSELDDLQNQLDDKAEKEHTHTMSDVTNLTTTLSNKSNVGHTHKASDITDLDKEISELLGDYPTTDEVEDLISDATKTKWWEKLLTGLEVLTEVAQTGYIYYLQTQIASIYQILVAKGIIDGAVNVMAKGTIGSLFSATAAGLSSSASAVNTVASAVGSTSSTVSKVTSTVQTISDHLNSYNSVGDMVSDISNNLDGYRQLVDQNLSDFGFDLEDLSEVSDSFSTLDISEASDPISLATNGLQDCGVVWEQGYGTMREVSNLINVSETASTVLDLQGLLNV